MYIITVMNAILEFLKGDWYKPVSICLFAFLMWQVTNHIPTQIEEVKQEVKEVRQDIKELHNKIDQNQKETNKRFDDIYKILLDIKNK